MLVVFDVVVCELLVALGALELMMLPTSALRGRELPGDLRGSVRIDRRAHGAGQDEGAAGDLAAHVRAGDEARDEGVERRKVGADGDLEREDLLSVLVEEECVGLPGALGDEKHAVGRLHDRVEHRRIGDQNVLQRDWKLHDERAADAKVNSLRKRECCIAGDAQHRIVRRLTACLARHVSRAHVSDASRDEENGSHAGARPLQGRSHVRLTFSTAETE